MTNNNKIPTAEEYGESLLPRGITWYKEFNEMMIGFAQLHVEAALKAASKKARLTDFASEFLQEGASDAIDEKSILNSYTKENIK